MSSEIVGTIFKVIAVAAPAVFVLLLLVVVLGNQYLVKFVNRRNDAGVRLSRLASEIARAKLKDLQSKEDCSRLLAALDDNERRVRALLAGDDLAEEIEDELHAELAKIETSRAEVLKYQEQIDQSFVEHSEFEDELRKNEARLQKMIDETRELEESYAPVAILIDRFLDYLTNGLRIVVTEPKSAHREAAK
jgi:chromosome segregation ATPase